MKKKKTKHDDDDDDVVINVIRWTRIHAKQRTREKKIIVCGCW